MDDGLTVEDKLTIDGDKLKGNDAVEFGAEKREWDIESKKLKNHKESPRCLEDCDGGGTRRAYVSSFLCLRNVRFPLRESV